MTTFNIKRGPTALNDEYKGLPGEITIDTDKRTLRVHDGLLFGGEELLRKTDLEEFVAGTNNNDKRSSVASSTVVYRAEASPGSADTAPAWAIQKITITYGTTVTYQTAWAGGTKSFVHKWSDRATYTYSTI